jgi:hexosaminidase
MKRLVAIFVALGLTVSGCSLSRRAPRPGGEVQDPPATIIPAPTELQLGEGFFRLTPSTRIVISPKDDELASIGRLLAEAIREVDPVSDARTGTVHLTLDRSSTSLGDEGYRLSVTEDSIALTAMRPAGLFYGVQTIRQLLPVAPEGAGAIPCVEIVDVPRFAWRGMLLDCGRHFMSKDFVKRYIDLLAYHKMNTLHWHLTEDQGWRIEIKSYPKLTEVGAWRSYEDGTRYSGFYTQDEIREVVEHASRRYVRVVPEIELPGHSVASLAAYPEHSCTGGPFAVETNWGVHKDVYCAGKERTFEFLEKVLTEVIELFPGPHVHIGGDECPKDRWKACSDCQARIVAEGLEDEHELQSYFIRRIERFLSSKGRRLIGWDEILEGGLAPEATVQSWRGMEGAIAAARSGHDAIVSPTSHAYFDYDIGTTDLRRVYSFEPIPPELTAAESRHILGGECNMWTERAPQETLDSKVFPRILAMAERLWSPKTRNNYLEFHRRVRAHYARLDRLGVAYGPESRPVTILPSFDRDQGLFRVNLEVGEEGLQVRYTTDSIAPPSTWDPFTSDLVIDGTALLRAQAFRDGRPYGAETSRDLVKHAGTGKSVVLASPSSPKYTGGGPGALTDGVKGSTSFGDGFWQGFEGDDLVATVDLGEPTSIRSIGTGFLENVASWIFFPTRVEYSVSVDGREFRPVATIENDEPPMRQDARRREVTRELSEVEARYVCVRATNVGNCPDWHPGAGGKAWIFADEIVIGR